MHAILLSNFYCDRTLLKLKKYRYVAKKKLEILYKKFRAAVFIKWGPESDNTVSASLKSGWPGSQPGQGRPTKKPLRTNQVDIATG